MIAVLVTLDNGKLNCVSVKSVNGSTELGATMNPLIPLPVELVKV